ncbi:VWA domain-containing protein [Myxosarcina sp. GI1]|uniref:vWA domain-containing protein n=1 Tax=Myxosarcina sp. GI1 TaxID=1541065 RepID=UPI0005652130|nr:VWA domain-containing protein [Myxosarcina sp. GI1]
MQVSIESTFSDAYLDAQQKSNQRQLSIAISAIAQEGEPQLPLNLCLVIDCNHSMSGEPLDSVKQAAIAIVRQLRSGDRFSTVALNDRAKTIVDNKLVADTTESERQINLLVAEGDTAIDEAMLLGIQQVAKGKQNSVSRIFLLTNRDNEPSSSQRCLKLALLAAEYKITIDTIGFGEHWNYNLLEQIADITKGTLSYIEQSEQTLAKLERLVVRARSVGLSNARLSVELMPKVRLAEFKPVSQVAPEAIELPTKLDGNCFELYLGDLNCDRSRVILINLYIEHLSPGIYQIASIRLRYDDLASEREDIYADLIPIPIECQAQYQPVVSPSVRNSISALARYRQIEIVEAKLQQVDALGAATMLQTAAQTSLQLGDELGAAVLQSNSTCLQQGKELSLGDRKKNLIVAKTIGTRE